MVAFTRHWHGRCQHLTVSLRPAPDGGARLVVAYPDGIRRMHRVANPPALHDATAALQAELTADGWTPAHAPARVKPWVSGQTLAFVGADA